MARTKLVLTFSVMLVLCVSASLRAENLAVGDKAPNFKAKTTDGKNITLADAKGAKAIVVCFTCNNCPVARAYEDRFIEFNKKYADKGVKFIAINANKTENLDEMKKRVEDKNINYIYAYDESAKSVADYGARVTPHMFVIDADGVVAYIGAFDDNMKSEAVKKPYVVSAIDAVLKGEKPEITETKAVGCSIKLKAPTP